MPTKDDPKKDADKPRAQPREYDPEREDFRYGGDMEQDDPDAEPHEQGRKGGHPHSIEEEDERDQRR